MSQHRVNPRMSFAEAEAVIARLRPEYDAASSPLPSDQSEAAREVRAFRRGFEAMTSALSTARRGASNSAQKERTTP